jgi:hypothetical protein
VGLIVLLLSVPSACGEIVGGGIGQAEVFVRARGEASEGSEMMLGPIPQAIDSGAVGATLGGLTGDVLAAALPFGGVLTLRVRVYLETGGALPYQITNGEREVSLDLSTGEPVSLGSLAIPSGAYTGIRAVFSQVVADVVPLEGSGSPIEAGSVAVDVGTQGSIAVTRSEWIPIADNRRLSVTVELDPATWVELGAQDPGRLAPASAFRSGVHLSAGYP